MTHDLVIVGAGLAGLSCARAAAAAGMSAVVLEKSRDVGGRCATRRFAPDGTPVAGAVGAAGAQPVDHGLCFLHGASPAFLAALDEVDAEGRAGWPARVRGSGTPCQPSAFEPDQRRVAFADGVKAFPRHVARGLDVRFGVRIVQLAPRADGTLDLAAEDGSRWSAPRVVLALPCEQARALIAPHAAASDTLRGADALLGMLGTLPALALVAGYDTAVPVPPWEMWYPEDSRVVHLVSHDSSKRAAGARLTLVVQAQPRWSRERLDLPPERWVPEMLAEVVRLAGPWAGTPRWTWTHRWRHARVDAGTELAAPILATLPGGTRLGLTGELFAPGGGAEAAWLAGRALATRLGSHGGDARADGSR